MSYIITAVQHAIWLVNSYGIEYQGSKIPFQCNLHANIEDLITFYI